MKTKLWKIIPFVAVLTIPRLAPGQVYAIDWDTIAGGAGTCTGGVYAVSGTIGQPAAGGSLEGGPYSLSGGFWAITLSQTTGAPVLHITNSTPGFATIWWSPSAPGFVLQSTDGLSLTNWVNTASGTNNPATVPIAGPMRLYRLRLP